MKKKILLFLALLLPFANMLFHLQSAIDPIKYIYIQTGTTAISLLIVTLLLSWLKRVVNLLRYRRMLGLFVFFYAFLHFLNFFILDAELSLSFVIKQTLDKPFIYLGMISFAILFFMAVTSKKSIFRRFVKWHQLVYIAIILVTIHASMSQKVLSLIEYFYIFIMIFIIARKLKERYSYRFLKRSFSTLLPF